MSKIENLKIIYPEYITSYCKNCPNIRMIIGDEIQNILAESDDIKKARLKIKCVPSLNEPSGHATTIMYSKGLKGGQRLSKGGINFESCPIPKELR